MRIRVRTRGVVDVLDVFGAPGAGRGLAPLREKVTELLDAGEPLLILNLSEVARLDSSCLGEIVTCGERVRKRDGKLKLVLTRDGRDLLAASKLDRVFEVFDDEDDALDSFVPEGATAGIP